MDKNMMLLLLILALWVLVIRNIKGGSAAPDTGAGRRETNDGGGGSADADTGAGRRDTGDTELTGYTVYGRSYTV